MQKGRSQDCSNGQHYILVQDGPRGNRGIRVGNFYTNFVVEGADSKLIMVAMGGLNAAILPCGKFIVVGEEESDSQDTEAIDKLTKQLSRERGTSVLAFMDHDDDILMY
jgi:hypothetical protein